MWIFQDFRILNPLKLLRILIQQGADNWWAYEIMIKMLMKKLTLQMQFYHNPWLLDRMTKGLNLIETGINLSHDIDSNEECFRETMCGIKKLLAATKKVSMKKRKHCVIRYVCQIWSYQYLNDAINFVYVSFYILIIFCINTYEKLQFLIHTLLLKKSFC